jgi:phosphoribosyl-AMP cyclohydrolase
MIQIGGFIMLELDFNKTGGLIPAIAQDHETGDVLMLAYMNEHAWKETLESGMATYYSRSRQTLWKKGETSGNRQVVKEIRVDCDNDTVLLKVEQIGGAACHLGYRSCFFRKTDKNGDTVIVEQKIFDPEKVYK